MSLRYRRCKDCGADRNDGALISKAGRCPRCGEARQVEAARKMREALESGRTSPENAPTVKKPAPTRADDIAKVYEFPSGDQIDA